MLMRRGIVVAGLALVALAVGFGLLGPDARDVRAATYEVNTTADHDDGNCDAAPDCTLREAITAAVASGDMVTFDITGTGPHVIQPLTNLPLVGGPGITGITIDGYTQPGASPNSAGPFQPGNADIQIVIDGSQNTEANGPGLWLAGPGITVRGLSIVNADAEGIKTSTLIGGLKIAGNYIGVFPNGSTAGPNGLGIEMRSSSTGNIIGGVAPADRNVISGNAGDGIWVPGGSAVVIAGNWVGVSASGNADAPNSTGIHLDPGTGSIIGGNSTGTGNLISGNEVDGVSLTSPDAFDINVKGNRIGTAANGIGPLGNGRHGVYLAQGAHDNTIGGEFNTAEQNVIAFNGDAGVALSSTAGADNYIDPNVTYSNGGLGTDLNEDGVTPNDATDSDAGPNNLMNFPEVESVMYDGFTLVVNGSLTTIPNVGRLMFIFSNSQCDPSGYGEGERFLGGAAVNSGNTGTGFFTRTLVPNPPLAIPAYITMSASDPESSSEFSLCEQVLYTGPSPTPTPDTPTATAPNPTPTPTATPATATPTATPIATPTHTPVQEVRHGDVNCDAIVNEVDVLEILLHVVDEGSQPVGSACPAAGDTYHNHLIGDLDCDGEITALDALIALLSEVPAAMLPLPSGCPALGDVL